MKNREDLTNPFCPVLSNYTKLVSLVMVGEELHKFCSYGCLKPADTRYFAWVRVYGKPKRGNLHSVCRACITALGAGKPPGLPTLQATIITLANGGTMPYSQLAELPKSVRKSLLNSAYGKLTNER